MRLADRIAQCRTPFDVVNPHDGTVTRLTGASVYADAIAHCATRYVLSDDLTRLCTALAYSKGASTLACADLLHVPAERVWVEWADQPFANELARYGIRSDSATLGSGRGGMYVQSDASGRRGLMRAFSSNGDAQLGVLASSMEAYFDFDTPPDQEPAVFDQQERSCLWVSDPLTDADILRRCFRFRFERSWREYYERGGLTPAQSTAVTYHALGTIALCVPVLLAFFLLLMTRPRLPRRPLMLERLNRARARSGKVPLLEQVEVSAPVFSVAPTGDGAAYAGSHRSRRLHHVRGHLVRRGSTLFWRVPHLRGDARLGAIRSRTVTWQFDPAASAHS